MSRERELLERVMYRIPSLVISEHDLDLVDEIKELLAQPEYEGLTPREALTEYKRGYAQAKLDLKREPLSDETICQILLKKEWKGFSYHNYWFGAFVDLVRIIEKCHNIGVDDE